LFTPKERSKVRLLSYKNRKDQILLNFLFVFYPKILFS